MDYKYLCISRILIGRNHQAPKILYEVNYPDWRILPLSNQKPSYLVASSPPLFFCEEDDSWGSQDLLALRGLEPGGCLRFVWTATMENNGGMGTHESFTASSRRPSLGVLRSLNRVDFAWFSSTALLRSDLAIPRQSVETLLNDPYPPVSLLPVPSPWKFQFEQSQPNLRVLWSDLDTRTTKYSGFCHRVQHPAIRTNRTPLNLN